MSSPILRRAARYGLRQRTTLATGKAIEAVAPMLDARHRVYAANIARRMIACAVTQNVRIVTPIDDATRIICTNARACRIRICAQCEYRRSCQMRRKLVRMFDQVWINHPHARAILIGLSTKNMPILQTRAMLKLHNAALARFWKLKRITSQTLGHFTSIELALRGTEDNPESGIHSHSVAFVPHTYFANGPAIWQPELRDLWRAAARLDYPPIVDVRLIQSPDGANDRDAVAASCIECAKYIVSSETLFQHDEGHIHVDGRVALAIIAAFRNVRTYRFDRCFSEAAKAIRMSDPV